MRLINKFKRLIAIKKEINRVETEELHKLWIGNNTPKEIILKENCKIRKEDYDIIKNRFKDVGIKVIIIPYCFDVISIDNKVNIYNG